MQKRLSAIIGLLLTVVMLMSFSVGTLEARAASSASYDTYLADYLLTNETAQSYINQNFKLPYRKYVEDRRNSMTYTAMLEAWEILTFDAKLADKTGKCVAYYETILYDTIYGGLDGNSELNDLTSKVSSAKASTMKTLMEYSENLIDYELEDIKKGTDLYDTLLKEFVTCEALKDAFENISDLKDQLDKCKDLYEAVEKVAKVEALVENQEQIKKIITDIGNSSANPALKLACARMTVIMDDVIPDQIIAGVFASESTIDEAVDDGFKAVWDAILVDVAGAKLTIAVKTGQKSGKLAAGMLFSTDKDVEHVYAMDALYDIEDITVNLVKKYQSQYQANPTQANAKLYTESFKQLIKTYIEGVDYSKTYAEITNEQGLINQLFKKFESDDYKRFISMLDDMRFTYEDYLNYIDVCVYNNYLADVPNATIKKKVKISTPKTTSITDADITSYFDTYKTVDMLYTNRVVDEEWILTEDYTTYGSLTIEADVDLNGYTLTVGGDVDHDSGEILFHNGTLKIDGDYLNATPSVDSGKKEYYDTSHGKLNMVWDNDYMLVGGNFITNTPHNSSTMSMGTIEVKGDILDYTSNNWFWNANDENKVILSGTGNQAIHFECDYAHFNDLEIKNSNSRVVTIDKYCQVNGTTTSDKSNLKVTSKDGIAAFGILQSTSINVTGNFELGNGVTTLSNSNITVNGDLTISDNIDMDSCTIYVTGMLKHNSGTILFHNGTLKIDGDYLNATPGVDSGKKEYYASSRGALNMVWDNDYMLVGGNFITNTPHNSSTMSMGTIEVKGDILDYTSNNWFWNANDENKVILSGTGNQAIHFECDYAHFNDLEIKNSNTRAITIDGYCWATGTTTSDKSNLKVTSKNGIAAFGKLKSTNIAVTGNFELGSGETILIDSDITVNGDLTISDYIDMDGCTVYVTGMLNHKSGEILFHNGTLKVDGDYLNATPSVDSGKKEYYASSRGALNMVWDNDYMLVGGNFITNTPHNSSTMSMGTIEVKGDILDYTSNNWFWNANDENKVILSGTGNQAIHFECDYAHFNDLEIQNANKRTIKLTGEFHANNIIVDGTLTINSSNAKATISNMTLKEGSSVTLTGNLNGVTSINKAAFTSDTTSSASSSSNVIKAVNNGSAKITISNSDTSSEITVNVEKPFELGDVNRDGEITVVDVIILQRWLLAMPNARLEDWKLADMNNDGIINIFDFCLLKRKLLNS